MSNSNRWRMVVTGVLALCLVVYFQFVGQRRIIDDDEGFYVLAGRELLGGAIPYRDFFFPQMPASTFLFGVWDAVGDGTLVSARRLAGLLAAVAGMLVFAAVRRQTSTFPAIVASLLFCAHILTFLWMPLAKTFSLTVPLFLGSLLLATSDARSKQRVFWAGLLVGLAACVRLPLVALIPLVALLVALPDKPDRRGMLAVTAIGCLVGLLPALVLFALWPAEFWFCNVTYHALRSGGDELVRDWPQKWQTLLALVGVKSDGYGAQCLFLLIPTLGAIAVREARKRVFGFGAAAFVLVILAFLPSPIWDQYFALTVAPCCIVVGTLLGRAPTVALPAVGLSVAIYVLIGWAKFEPHILASTVAQRPGSEDAIGVQTREQAGPGAVIATRWPAYLLSAGSPYARETLNQFTISVAPRLNERDRRRFHVFGEAELRDAIRAARFDAYISGREDDGRLNPWLRSNRWTPMRLSSAVVWLAPRGPKNDQP